jgi:hypothetical protein
MRIAKPILLVSTPIGVIGGLVEGYRMAGGLVFIMVAMVVELASACGRLPALGGTTQGSRCTVSARAGAGIRHQPRAGAHVLAAT